MRHKSGGFRLGRALVEAGPPRPSVSGCERQEVKGTSGAEAQDV